jgi:cyanophycinase
MRTLPEPDYRATHPQRGSPGGISIDVMETLAMKRLLLALAALPITGALAGTPHFEYYRTGGDDVPTDPSPGIVLMGGSTDVDAAFRWLCTLANHGDLLVLRARGTEAYDPYIWTLCNENKENPETTRINSVATLIVPSATAANAPEVQEIIANAEAIWIAGGDQSNYVNYWTHTPVQWTLQERLRDRVPVGGTSAGMNVLTQFIYTAQASKGVTSEQALDDPFNRYMSFDRDFVDLPVLAGVIGDPHFAARDRLGRDLAFLCRVWEYGWSDTPRGIAVDERTALLIDPDTAVAQVVGEGSAYFMEAPGAPEICASKTPLTYRDIAVDRIQEGRSRFDLDRWRLQGGGGLYNVSAVEGMLEALGDNFPY